MEPFGGLEPDAIRDLIGSGYATWVVPDGAGKQARAAFGATVVEAPQEVVYRVCTEFRALPRHLSMIAPPVVRELGGDRLEVDLEARVGLAVFKLKIPLRFRFRREPPVHLHFEEYLGGAFTECVFEVHTHALSGDRTLLVLGFHGDVRSLNLVTRIFLRRAPELELAISGNMVVIPLSAMAQIAEREVGRSGGAPTEVDPVQDRLESLAPLLGDGILTVGRIGHGGRIADVCSATRVAAPPERVWDLVTSPSRLSRAVSFIEGGSVRPVGDDLALEVNYKASFGPLKKRYRIGVRATAERPHRLDAILADTNGVPATYGDVVVPVDGGSLYAHRYSTDLRRDWLSRRFLGAHPELERLIAQYPPMMQVLGVRQHFVG